METRNSPSYFGIVSTIAEVVGAAGGTPKQYPPNYEGIVKGLQDIVIAKGGTIKQHPPNYEGIVAVLSRIIQASGGDLKEYPPNYFGIVTALAQAVTTNGGTSTEYPPNYEGIVKGLEDLKNVIGGSSPQPPLTNLVGWWEADSGLTTDTSAGTTTVSTWADRTGTANNNATQATKTKQPLIATYNDKQVLRFNGSTTILNTAGASYACQLLVVVFRKATTNFVDYDGIVSCRANPNAQKNSASNEDIGTAGRPTSNTITAVGTATGIHLDGVAQNLTNYNDFNTGIALGAATEFHLISHEKTNSVAGSKFWTFGADIFSTGRFLNGDIALILMYSSTAQRLEAEAYGKQKYGIA